MSLAAPAVFGSGHAVKERCETRLARDIVSRGEKRVKLAGNPRYSSMRLRVLVESTLMPGPMVVVNVTDLT